jgi:glutamine phosphoribosylpyrophosphate amidotransferase
MCALIGFYGKKNDKNIDLLRKIFIESQIRGKHATGLSFLLDNEIETFSESIPSYEFVELFPFNLLPEDLILIGHTRYSTSDLRFNQPIDNRVMSIVHNGIITQEDPCNWKDDFGYSCVTCNDSELIIKSFESNKHPLVEFGDSSISSIVLNAEGLRFFRNGNRPLWYLLYNEAIFVASTKDIFLRSFFDLNISPVKCKVGVEYKIDSIGFSENFIKDFNDLQINLECSNYYSPVYERL